MRGIRRCGFVEIVLALLKEIYHLEGSMSLMAGFEFLKVILYISVLISVALKLSLEQIISNKILYLEKASVE